MSIRDSSFVISLYDGLTSNKITDVNYYDFVNNQNIVLVPMNFEQYKIWLCIQEKLNNKEDCRLIGGYNPS